MTVSAVRGAHSRYASRAALELPVIDARFVDKARAEAMARIGIRTIRDLLYHVPFRYLDLTNVRSLADVSAGSDATVVGVVHDIRVKRPRPRLTITEVGLFDGTGAVIGVWFNQPWVQQRFSVGERVAFAGRVELDYGLKRIKTPFVERLQQDSDEESLGRVLPIHRTTEGLTTGWLRRLIAALVDDRADLPDPVPARLRLARGMVPLRTALRDVHFPPSLDDAERARQRLAYDELLALQLYMALRRHALTVERAGIAHEIHGPALSALRGAVPFELTAEQREAIGEILDDMAGPAPMNRMLLGDVGTGKTVVAAHALASAADTGTQAAMMAPTEVLATQYAVKIGPLLEAAGISYASLTGSTPRKERAAILDRLSSGAISVLFGTHAILEAEVEFNRLSLAIVDEQHRFGVNQRLGLRGKGVDVDLLVMTATPIPRSLALTLYGDLATTYLRQRPVATAGVSTSLVAPHQTTKANKHIEQCIAAGQQAYVICALVDESDSVQAKAATREYERLRSQVFPRARVELLTGKMRPAEKASVMDRFRAGEIDVLVSTTVVEVGVDVPNATAMIIENAERYGIAQLHQLRGRVGRGAVPGRVWLVSDVKAPDKRARLEAVVATTDGFELAERDLELRGEGSVFGDRQHGLPELRIADLIGDMELVVAARDDAVKVVAQDPTLTSPELAPLLEEVRRMYKDAWNWVSAG